MMSDEYPDGTVSYKVLDFAETLTADKVSIAKSNDMDTMRSEVQKAFPFSHFATDAMVAILREASRLNQIDD